MSTSLLNLQDLQNHAASLLDDPNQTYFTANLLQIYLNNAQKEVQRLLIQAHQNWYLTCVQQNLITSQPDYNLPADFMMLNRLDLILSGIYPNEDTTTISPITLNQMSLLPFTVAPPEGYFLKKNTIFLRPAPDLPYLARLYYTYLVADMINLSDVPDVPVQYNELISLLAVKDGFVKDDRDSSKIDNKIALYTETFKRDAQNRTLDRPRMIVITDDGGFGTIF